MKVFVINLEKDVDRKLSIQTQLEELNLDAEFITGVYGRGLSDEQLKTICPNFNKIYLTLGEVGCSMSHLNVYKKMIDKNISIALILEDDVIFDHNLIAVLSSLEKGPQALSSNPFVFLLNKTNEYFDSFKKPLTDKHNIVNVIDSAGSFGYILNLAAAKKLYQYLQPIRFAADEWKIFREHGAIKLKDVIPLVVGLSNFNLNSSIGNYRIDERT
ncbi:glycosyltransferase family 25 protein [Xenorhabdus khoisanae]|uniref:glycosyltransferase family 25 protein n=1 Tax=Xenorhabdus khoisanae TaxID=880157 RepID=UPI00235A051C|nr:glycosyltransferase family 25 protein [Xenorhabdus khoisanae]MDC9614873.1 glycosyltransferase family 25 protein [Xenorhabdus khoisanae]